MKTLIRWNLFASSTVRIPIVPFYNVGMSITRITPSRNVDFFVRNFRLWFYLAKTFTIIWKFWLYIDISHYSLKFNFIPQFRLFRFLDNDLNFFKLTSFIFRFKKVEFAVEKKLEISIFPKTFLNSTILNYRKFNVLQQNFDYISPKYSQRSTSWSNYINFI